MTTEEKSVKDEKEKEEVKAEEKKEEKKAPQAKEEAKPAEPKKEKAAEPTIELTKKMKDVLKNVEEMSVLELSKLVKALEEKFGVSAAAPVMMAAGGAAAPGEGQGQGQEEKSTFNVILAAVGDKKIQVIKEIRTVTTLGLKEAKDLVDQAPKPIKEGIAKEEAEEIKKKLEAVGATVELK